MAHALALKHTVTRLRRSGCSIPAIARITGLAKSTVSLWVRGVELPAHVRCTLAESLRRGQEKGRAMMARRRMLVNDVVALKSRTAVEAVVAKRNKYFFMVAAALLYWCEGAKRLSTGVVFTNSDPRLVTAFLTVLRAGFAIDESKLTARIHLHEYHDAGLQTERWSAATGIPVGNFRKPYLKPHTGKRKRLNYPGCISVRYGDASVARHIFALYDAFAQAMGAWCNG